MIADEHAYIKARMEQIKAERLQAPAEYEMQTAVEQYLGGEPKEPEPKTYMGWDIYAPVNMKSAFGGPASSMFAGITEFLDPNNVNG